MFRRLLIANRGEIACRIIRTARALGMHTIAVHSAADRGAAHVALADEAHEIGPPPARDSYLNQAALLDIARLSRADAVHPGYGFLAEDATFASAVEAAGLVFVGPTPHAISAMGSKAEAKRIMAAAGVPLLPGYHGTAQETPALTQAARDLGFPLLIKPAAGGGGKGMRVVTTPGEFAPALTAARREARGAFGDDQVILERYLARPRHIEVQVFGDAHGHLISLFERDCSVQRRYQKVLEEAPAPGLDDERRAALSAAAVQAARAIDYRGAGTVEFILQDGEFAFMEMNTRLQVEHPVTEMILGIDLVEWQLRVAAGEPLPATRSQLSRKGHAVEARVYAEDPAAGFLPATGLIRHLRWPQGEHVRVDAGVRAGDSVSPYYDPMLAKIVAWGEDRSSALRRLSQALAECEIVGLTTNVAFLHALTQHEEVRAGPVDTGFVARTPELLQRPHGDHAALALAALGWLLKQQTDGARQARDGAEPDSPWLSVDGFRANLPAETRMTLADAQGERHTLTLTASPDGFMVGSDGEFSAAAVSLEGSRLGGVLADRPVSATVLFHDGGIDVLQGTASARFTIPGAGARHAELAHGSLAAPMPGQVIEVKVAVGDAVAAGDTLVIVEAMKMEHAVAAPAAGRVAELFCKVGERVREGVALVRLDDV